VLVLYIKALGPLSHLLGTGEGTQFYNYVGVRIHAFGPYGLQYLADLEGIEAIVETGLLVLYALVLLHFYNGRLETLDDRV